MEKTFEITKRETSLILDFHVRWNSTYLMLERLRQFKEIINMILNDPDRIDGLTVAQKSKLNDVVLSYTDWILIDALIHVLSRFYEVTKILSGRKYPTLSLAFIAQKMLENFLSTLQLSESLDVMELKRAFLPIFKYHFEEKISEKQKEATLVII